MKNKRLAIVSAAILSLLALTQAQADTRTDTGAVLVDAAFGRPVCLLTTVLGSAVFVVTLPFAATSGSIHTSAEALVLKPGKETFVRPLGDFHYQKDENANYMYSRAVGKRAPRAKTRS